MGRAQHRISGAGRVKVGGADGSHQVYEVPSRGRWYFRYVVNAGRRIVLSLHIPGGDRRNPVASARAAEVARWISVGRSPADIKSLIRSWSCRSFD